MLNRRDAQKMLSRDFKIWHTLFKYYENVFLNRDVNYWEKMNSIKYLDVSLKINYKHMLKRYY